MAKCLILLAFLFGCSNATIPNQDKALQLVWYGVYQETDDPPDIYWVEKLNCFDMKGYYRGGAPTAVVDSGQCVGGAYWSDWQWIDLAHNSDVFSETAFSHELLHAHLKRLLGNGNGEHTLPEWGSSQGKPENLWDFAQQTLIANGL